MSISSKIHKYQGSQAVRLSEALPRTISQDVWIIFNDFMSLGYFLFTGILEQGLFLGKVQQGLYYLVFFRSLYL